MAGDEFVDEEERTTDELTEEVEEVEDEEEEDIEDEQSTDGSEDSHGVADDSVLEDMLKFQQTFGSKINEHYRLINRIGEGECKLIVPRYYTFLLTRYRHFLHSLQGRGSQVRLL